MDTNGKNVADDARETLRDVQGRVTERMEDLRGYAGSADEAIRAFAREKPILAIACAAGIGFVLGRLASRM